MVQYIGRMGAVPRDEFRALGLNPGQDLRNEPRLGSPEATFMDKVGVGLGNIGRNLRDNPRTWDAVMQAGRAIASQEASQNPFAGTTGLTDALGAFTDTLYPEVDPLEDLKKRKLEAEIAKANRPGGGGTQSDYKFRYDKYYQEAIKQGKTPAEAENYAITMADKTSAQRTAEGGAKLLEAQQKDMMMVAKELRGLMPKYRKGLSLIKKLQSYGYALSLTATKEEILRIFGRQTDDILAVISRLKQLKTQMALDLTQYTKGAISEMEMRLFLEGFIDFNGTPKSNLASLNYALISAEKGIKVAGQVSRTLKQKKEPLDEMQINEIRESVERSMGYAGKVAKFEADLLPQDVMTDTGEPIDRTQPTQELDVLTPQLKAELRNIPTTDPTWDAVAQRLGMSKSDLMDLVMIQE